MEIIISNLPQETSKEELQCHITQHFGKTVFSLIEQHRGNDVYLYGLATIRHNDDAETFITAINHSEFHGHILDARPYVLRTASNDKRTPGSDEIQWFGHEKRVRERRALVKNIIRHQD